MATTTEIRFADLLNRAVTEPGILSRAYSQFHSFSLGNVLLAAMQCAEREIPLGPLATYRRWQELGRQVRKGQKAITLCQPVTIRKKGDEASEGTDDEVFLRFVFRAGWFVISQTDGAEIAPAEIPEWQKDQALTALGVSEIPYAAVDGNILGYARGHEVAINPVNPMPFKTLFHELAHVLLGHTAEGQQSDSEVKLSTPRHPVPIQILRALTVAVVTVRWLPVVGERLTVSLTAITTLNEETQWTSRPPILLRRRT